jgi:hypothetical protein
MSDGQEEPVVRLTISKTEFERLWAKSFPGSQIPWSRRFRERLYSFANSLGVVIEDPSSPRSQ